MAALKQGLAPKVVICVKRISIAGIAAKQDDEVVHQVEGQRVMPSRRWTCVLLLGSGQAVPLPGVVEDTSCRLPTKKHRVATRGVKDHSVA